MTPDEIKEFNKKFGPYFRLVKDPPIWSPMLKEWIESLLSARQERLLAVIEEVRGKYKGDGLQGSRAFFYEQCCDDLAERIKSGI